MAVTLGAVSVGHLCGAFGAAQAAVKKKETENI